MDSQLRERVAELEALLSAAEDEIEKKDEAILELWDNLTKLVSFFKINGVQWFLQTEKTNEQ